MMVLRPEQRAQNLIIENLIIAGWELQNPADVRRIVNPGIEVGEFSKASVGLFNYLLLINQQLGVIKAKKRGKALAILSIKSVNYSVALLFTIPEYCDFYMPLGQLNFWTS